MSVLQFAIICNLEKSESKEEETKIKELNKSEKDKEGLEVNLAYIPRSVEDEKLSVHKLEIQKLNISNYTSTNQ